MVYRESSHITLLNNNILCWMEYVCYYCARKREENIFNTF